MSNDFFRDFFKGLADMYSEEIELAAIWMDKPVVHSTGRTVRLVEGMEIKVEGNQIVDLVGDEKPTHKILGCYGTVSSSSLGFILLDIQTQEPSTLKIK